MYYLVYLLINKKKYKKIVKVDARKNFKYQVIRHTFFSIKDFKKICTKDFYE